MQGRRLKLEISEVNHDSLSHDVSSNKYIDLLKETSTFSVADLVIHIDCIVGVIDCYLNWVCSPLSVVVESLPQEMETDLMRILDVAELFAFGKTHHGAIFSKAFLEPEVIPPFHCD